MEYSRILKIIIFFICLMVLLQTSVSAKVMGEGAGEPGFSIENLTGDTQNTEELQTIGDKIIQIVSTIASIISVIVLIVLGIKYMLGSVEEKAEYKKTLLPYVIGAGFVFAASGIASLVYNIAINI